MNNERLAAKVEAKNRANRILNDLDRRLAPVLAGFVGKTVELAVGGLSSKLEAACAPIFEEFRTQGVQIWLSSVSAYRIYLNVRVCVSSEHGYCYSENAVSVLNV